MKNRVQPPSSNLFGYVAKLKRYNFIALMMMLAALPCIGWADTSWTGANSTDWMDAGNWDSGLPSPGNYMITIDNISVNTPSLSTSVSAGWDINIGNGGHTGALNQSAGTLATGSGNWGFIGVDNSSVGTYNLTGSASFSAARINLGAFGNGTGGTGTLNLNTTGTVDAYGNNTGNWWQDNTWQIGSDHGSTGTINLTNGTIHSNGNMWLGAFSGTGILNQSGGTVNVGGNLALARMWTTSNNGNSDPTVGTATITGGTLNADSITGAYSGGGGDISHGTLTVSGTGVVNSEHDLVLAAGGTAASTGVVNVNSGGTVNVATTTKRWLQMNQWDSVQATLNVNGGTLNLNANTDLRFSVNGGTGTSAVNLNSGTITSYSGNQTGAGAGALVFNSGNAAGADNTVNLNGGTLTISQIISGGSGGTRVFNFNGGTLKPTAATASFFASGVASAANVLASGAIIDTAGYNITIGQTLSDGGGGGGLTKVGNGTLTLTGGYGYTGPTIVSAGTLAVDASQTTSASALTVSNATLSLSLNNGNTSLSAGNITLAGTNVLNLNFGTATSPAAAAIYANGYTVSNTGTNTINLTGQYLTVGQYPLIYTGASVPTNNFVLGTKPTGVVAVLTNSGTSLDLLITSSGQTLAWYGADNAFNPLTTWDINSSSNWNSGASKYLQYSGNSYGDNVTFDDGVYDQSDADITLNAAVVPASVDFNNSSYSYSITGSGGIGGGTSVEKNGSALAYLGTANSYTGGTIISAGTLAVTNDGALGASGSAVTLNGGTLQFSNSTASSRSITVNSNSTINVAAGATAQLSGTVSSGASLTDNGPGTLTLAGTVTTPVVAVGGAAGDSVLSISGTLIASNLFVGNASGAVGAVYQTGGTVTANGGGGDCLNVGNLSGAFGYYNVKAGTLTANGVAVGGENNTGTGFTGTGGDGIMEITGGSVTNTGWLVMNRGDSTENGILNIFSGSLSFAGGGLVCNWGSGQTAIINVLGGSLATTANNAIGFVNGTGIVNLLGGVVNVSAINGAWTGDKGQVNFNGGTLQASGGNPTFLAVTAAHIYSNGATIDDGGYAVGLDQPLLAPVGYGVSTIVPSDGGSGYVAPPIVLISGGSGSNATAIAQINVATGTITNLLVTCPGAGYISGDTLTATYSGGGSSAVTPVSTTVNLAANTSGGLIKKGAGTLTLTGVNTYTGVTVVSNGTLKVAGPPVLHLSFDNVSGTNVINDGTGGLAMNGALYGSATIVSGGQFGNCLSISGADASSASCRIASSVVPLTVGAGSSWTVSMWVQSSTAGGCYAYQGDGGWGWANTTFHLNNGSADGAGSQAGGVRWGEGWETGTASINDGAWHQVVLTCNGNTKAAYVDGVLDTLTTDQWGNVGLGSQFWIGGGANTGDGTANLNGLVDEVYVFDRAINVAEIQSLYSANSLPSTSTPIVAGAITVASGATLGGNGIVGGPVTVQSGGTIAVGASSGTLTINNNLTLGGNVLAEVNTSVSAYNDLVVTGVLTNSGTGTVTLSNLGPALTAGNSFTLFSKALANGNAMTITTTPALASGLVLSNRLSLDGSVLVVSTGPGIFSTPPTIGSLSLSGENVVITGTSGEAGAAYYLLSSTNIVLPLNQWQTVATNVLNASGSFTFIGTNAVKAGDQQQFYILSNTNYNP
jgi:autotransporter-associated beta strand protein